MATLRFEVKKVNDSYLTIRAVFQHSGQSPAKNLKENIPANKIAGKWKYWDKNKQRVKSHPDEARINAMIDKWRARFNRYVDDCKRDDLHFDLNMAILITTGKREQGMIIHTLQSVAETFNKTIREEVDTSTYKSYEAIYANIKEYQEEIGKPILITEVNKLFYRQFSAWLIEEKENINSTILRKIGRIITIMNFAEQELKIKGLDSEFKYKPKLKELDAPKFPLTEQELTQLWNLKVGNAYRQMVIDAFLLSTETSLRFSDIIQIQPQHIQSFSSANGNIRYIHLTTEKTDKRNSTPLSDKAAGIIDKYIGYLEHGYPKDITDVLIKSRKGANDKVLFPFTYSQAVSRILKEEFKEAKFNRPCEVVTIQGAKTTKELMQLHQVISFHTARNTYITRMLQSNLAPAFVQANAGLSDLKMTMRYYRENDAVRWEETLKVLNKEKPVIEKT